MGPYRKGWVRKKRSSAESYSSSSNSDDVDVDEVEDHQRAAQEILVILFLR